MAATSCGMLADTFGNFIILASGVFASSPNSASSSACFWASVRFSGNWAMIRPLTDMSFVTTETYNNNNFMIGTSFYGNLRIL